METTTRICALRELIPATPIHPGEMIKDELQAQGGKHGQTDPVRTVQIDPFKTA